MRVLNFVRVDAQDEGEVALAYDVLRRVGVSAEAQVGRIAVPEHLPKAITPFAASELSHKVLQSSRAQPQPHTQAHLLN